MPDRISFENMALSVKGRPSGGTAKPNDETPFRVLVLGDFSGRSSRAVVEPLGGRRVTMVDVDNLDQAVTRTKPTLSISIGEGKSFSHSFSALDDFHPDKIFQDVPLLQKLRDARRALHDPSTAREAAAALASCAGAAAPSAPKEAPVEKDEELFARLLGVTPEELPRKTPPASGSVHDLLRQVIAPYVVAAPDPNVAAMKLALDAAISDQMRAILRASVFQELEAAWRGLDFLVRNLETDETLQIYLCDISKDELAADLGAVEDLAEAGIFQTLVEEPLQTPGGVQWAVIVGNYHFDTNDDDAALLARVAKISAAAGAPFFGAAASSSITEALADRPVSTKGWSLLRALPEARWVSLAGPRFLLRLPYGRETESIESFEFEEMCEPGSSAGYLWGNPAIVCGYLLGESFRSAGWDLAPGDIVEVAGLPVHTFVADGEKKMTPCAERWLTDRQADALLKMGIMPLLSIRGRDAVRLLRFQSVAEPPAQPAGSWT